MSCGYDYYNWVYYCIITIIIIIVNTVIISLMSLLLNSNPRSSFLGPVSPTSVKINLRCRVQS